MVLETATGTTPSPVFLFSSAGSRGRGSMLRMMSGVGSSAGFHQLSPRSRGGCCRSLVIALSPLRVATSRKCILGRCEDQEGGVSSTRGFRLSHYLEFSWSGVGAKAVTICIEAQEGLEVVIFYTLRNMRE